MNFQFCPHYQRLSPNLFFQNPNLIIQQIFFQAEKWGNINLWLKKHKFQSIDLKVMDEFQSASKKTVFEQNCPKTDTLFLNSSFPTETEKLEKFSDISIPTKTGIQTIKNQMSLFERNSKEINKKKEEYTPFSEGTNLHPLQKIKDKTVFQNLNVSDTLVNIKLESNLKTEAPSIEEDKTIHKHIKEEGYNYKQEYNTSSENNHNTRSPKINDITSNHSLRDIISHMLFFFIRRFGKACQNEINQQRIQYAHNKQLLKVFDILVEKYHASTKSKEDMVRFCVRKALTFLRNNLKDELKTTQRGASLALCKKYFQNISGEIKTQEDHAPKETNDNILNYLLPYKKNSRNKTPNICFIKEVFSSEEFTKDYILFLSKFDDILSFENIQKISKFINFIFECVINSAIDKIMGYLRLPWLDFWSENTKILARELVDIHGWKGTYKKSKE